MKILIIEDNDMKYEAIVEYFNSLGEKDISRSKSRNSGLCELWENSTSDGPKYNIVIIDMMLPIYEDGREMDKYAGIRILKEVDRKKYDIEAVLCTGENIERTTEKFKAFDGTMKERELFSYEGHTAKIKPNMSYIQYNSSVYQKDDFNKVLETVIAKEEERALDKPVTTYVVSYHSFDAPTLKICNSRREALDYMFEDSKEEIRLQTANGRELGVDMVLTGDAYHEEFLKLTYENGDFITWSIPEVI